MTPPLRIFVVSGLFLLLSTFPLSLTAESFPSPGSGEGRSLLGIPYRIEGETSAAKGASVTIEGARQLKLKAGKEAWDIQWFRVNPGAYGIDPSSPGVDMGTVGRNGRFEVQPDTIMVSPFRIVFTEGVGSTVARLELVDEEDRQRAALRLALYFDFPGWHGREYVGFGSLRPSVDQDQTLFQAELRSTPGAAEVYLDDRLVGTTPLKLSLTGVKHKVLFRNDGYEDATRYIRLERDAAVDVELLPAETLELGDAGETFRTVIGTFLPMGSADMQLADLFADTLEIALDEDERLEVSREDIAWDESSGITYPDFEAMDESGADLIISGFFRKDENNLIVQANLYDVQAESTKAGFTWSGEVGLSIFDAMDEITESFMESVERYLPAAGRTLETRTEILYEGASREEYDLFRNYLIQERWQSRRHALTLQFGFGGTNEDIEYVAPGTSDSRSGGGGPGLGINLDWTYDLSEFFGLTTGLSLTPVTDGGDGDRATDTSGLPLKLGLYFGPKLIFRNLKSDLYFGVSAQVKWSPANTVSWDEGTAYSVGGGSFIYLGLPIDAGIRYYFAERSTQVPWYFNAGISLSFLGYRFDVTGRIDDGPVSFDALLYLGVGVRL